MTGRSTHLPADTVTLVARTLSAIAVPRLCASDGWRRTTRDVRDRLDRLGYDVTNHDFEFSDWPARFGAPLVGGFISVAFWIAWLAVRAGAPGLALAVLVGLHVVTALLFIASERFLLRLPWGRRIGVNLLAVSGPARPRWIVVAHRDSKSQPLPIALRVIAAALATIVWTMLLAGAAFEIANVPTPLVSTPVAATGIAAGLILLACTTGNKSPGALDNASGVAALMGIAAQERGNDDVAFLVTDAEEFGLAGASAMAGALAWAEAVINLDGLDDRGPFHLLGRHGTPRRGGAPVIERTFCELARFEGEAVHIRNVPRGLALDHLAFTRAGVPALTVMRGTLRSMLRVHRPADHAARITGQGAALTADLICRVLDRLRSAGAQPPDPLDYSGKKMG
ncbi:MAG: M28 family peptidase [Longimicrobiales bacterium]